MSDNDVPKSPESNQRVEQSATNLQDASNVSEPQTTPVQARADVVDITVSPPTATATAPPHNAPAPQPAAPVQQHRQQLHTDTGPLLGLHTVPEPPAPVAPRSVNGSAPITPRPPPPHPAQVPQAPHTPYSPYPPHPLQPLQAQQPPPHVAHAQPPILMDRCPRCAYVPTMQQGQQPPPLPPYGSAVPPHMHPPPPTPQNWPQQHPQYPPPPRPYQLRAPPPVPPSQPPVLVRRPPSPPRPVSSSAPRKESLYQVPPEFRTARYFPNGARSVPIHALPAFARPPVEEPPAPNPPDPDAPDPSDWLPISHTGYVVEPFIPPPKYAPVPTMEAIAKTAPKWPKNRLEGDASKLDGLSRRERQKLTGPQRMTRDQRRDVLLMRRLGYQFESIARFLGTTISACHYTCRRGTPEVNHKNAGRRVRIPPEIATRMVEYVKSYQKQERAAGVDKKTGKKKMQQLTYNMIRDHVLRGQDGEIPTEFKYTDDALKTILNKFGLWLRAPMSQARKEAGRVRGKKQWQDKLAKDRAEAQSKAAEAEAAGQPVSEELAALARGTIVDEAESDIEVYAEADSDEEDEGMDVVSVGSTDDDDGHGDGQSEDEQIDNSHLPIGDQLRRAIAAPR